MAAEFDELYRDAISLITHDLRGAASALALRADVLAEVLSARDRDAFKSLSAELLEIDNTLHLIQSVHATHATVSERRVGGNQWWHITTRLSAHVLPRGSRQVAQCDTIEITSREGSLFTHAWLAACKGLVGCTEIAAQPIQATLDFRSCSVTGKKPHVELAASAKFATPTAVGQLEIIEASLRQSRWLRYANRIARKNQATLSWWSRRDATFVWKCTM